MKRAYLLVAAVVPLAAAILHCGDRTGLLGGLSESPADAAIHLPVDAGRDADAARDVGLDALPPIDASHGDASRAQCPDAGIALIYVFTQQNNLYSFDPSTLAFRLIGPVACPTTASPWSMAVDRQGLAYALFDNGDVFRLSMASGACTPTSFAPGQHGFTTFGMGYAADTTDTGETLYVSENHFGDAGPSLGLGIIDTTTFKLSVVGPYDIPLGRAELTGTPDGRLFAFVLNQTGTGSRIAEISRTTARVIASSALQVGQNNNAFAFAAWGGDFWVFTTPSGGSTVTRFRPSDGSEVVMTTAPETIVGAGVSTCAPGGM